MVAVNSPEQVARIVQERLNNCKRPCTVRVLADRVRRGDGEDLWWYVPVVYQQDPDNAYRYFELFSAVEEGLEAENLNILIVPHILAPPSNLDN